MFFIPSLTVSGSATAAESLDAETDYGVSLRNPLPQV